MPTDPRDYKLDLSTPDGSEPDVGSTGSGSRNPRTSGPGRPYLSVHFACCGIYTRIYRSADGSAYRGRCPRCGRPVNFLVGEGGTDARVFVVH